MQIMETEYLKPCPFCGGKPVLRVMDNNSQNGTVTTEIRCGNCRSAGKTTVSFNHSVVVGGERHKEIIKETVDAWNRRAGEQDNQERLVDVRDTLLDLSCLLEKGLAATRNLSAGYFGDRLENHKENNGMWLLYDYDAARVFSDIANDYVYRAFQTVEELDNRLAREDMMKRQESCEERRFLL